jgi:hypothetical protein
VSIVKPRRPVLVFFQEVKPGDIRKQQAASNDARSGGGARDLRIRPAAVFARVLSSLFPVSTDEEGVFLGRVHWYADRGTIHHAEVEFWRPTDARPGEARVGRIHTIASWTIDAEVYDAARARGLKWFYLLVKDAEGIVWAGILREENFEKERPEITEYIRARIRSTQTSHAVRGMINFETRETYP